MADKLLSKIKKSSFGISPQKTYTVAANRIKVNIDPIDESLKRNRLIGGIPPVNFTDSFIITENLDILITENNNNLVIW